MSFSPAETLLYTTTRVTAYGSNGHNSQGTGFFYRVFTDREAGLGAVLLITNRHVLQGFDQVEVTLPLRDKDSQPTGERVTWRQPLAGRIKAHPDPDVDLVAIDVLEWHYEAPDGAIAHPFYIPLDRDAIPAPDVWSAFDAIEEVTMVGCPNGLFDEVNNLPIVRRGITATHPGKSYQGKEELMVDLACFPGSSGSPIFLYSTGARYDRKSRGFSFGSVTLYLLGILYSGPTINQQGHIVLTQQPATVTTASMMHLGIALKSTQLLAFDQLVHQQAQVH